MIAFVFYIFAFLFQAIETKVDPSTVKTVLGFVITTGAIAGVVKLLVDIAKGLLPERASKILPLLALLLGFLIQLVAGVANGESFTAQTIAVNFFAGVLSGGGAIGLTAGHEAVR